MCVSRKVLPSSYMLPNGTLVTDVHLFSSGGFSDVYRGTFNGLQVCVKKLRVAPDSGSEQATKGDTCRHYFRLCIVSNLMATTGAFPGSFAVEAIGTSQHRAIRGRDHQPSPNRVRVYAERRLADLRQIALTA